MLETLVHECDSLTSFCIPRMPSIGIFLDEVNHESIPDIVRLCGISHNAVSIATNSFCTSIRTQGRALLSRNGKRKERKMV